MQIENTKVFYNVSQSPPKKKHGYETGMLLF